MKQPPVFLIVAGTVYGRKLCHTLCEAGAQVYATVATEYGEELLQSHENLTVLAGRLQIEEMEQLIQRLQPDALINTAHPYAVEVNQNSKAACDHTNTYYLRLIREELDAPDAVYVKDMEDAVGYLSNREGNIFSSCGSKEMQKLVAIDDYKKRVFVRALPTEDFINKAKELGFSSANLICMQGPFSKELNKAMLQSTNAKYLLTKDSGSAGGFGEKLDAAKELGITTIIVGRPKQQKGFYYHELLAQLTDEFDLQLESTPKQEQRYFPLFVSLVGKRVKVFGAGSIAKRRIATLLEFDCRVEVIAPEIAVDIPQGVFLEQRAYQQGDCVGADLVLAVTNDKEVNRLIALECKKRNIPVSVCDNQELCTFFFPAIAVQDNMVVGVTSSGKGHKEVKRIADRIRKNILHCED